MPAELLGVALPRALDPIRPWVRALSGLVATIPLELLRRWRSINHLAASPFLRIRIMVLHLPWFLVFVTASWASQLRTDREQFRRLRG